jgi:hypothetical protein
VFTTWLPVPTLDVVIPLIGNDALASCLDRLPLTAMECIVVLREAMGAVTDWEQRYPSVTFLGAAHEPVPCVVNAGFGPLRRWSG